MTAVNSDDLDKVSRRNQLLAEKQAAEQEARARLTRDYIVNLRDASNDVAMPPANPKEPSFRVGPTPGLKEPEGVKPSHDQERGHLSKEGWNDVKNSLQAAGKAPDAASRDAATGGAAKVVTREFAHKHGIAPNKESILHEARSQIAMNVASLADRAGLDPVSARVVGVSLERALEKEGFRVLAQRTVDGVGMMADKMRYSASAAATGMATGMRATLENSANKSMAWLAEHGVTREALKEVLAKHSGKFTAAVEVAMHPQALQRGVQLLAKSDTVFNGLAAVATDKEFRTSLGTLTLATGEALAATGGRSVGSVAILAGAAMKGETNDEIGRHAFRAGMAVAFGVAAGAAAGSVSFGAGSIAGGIVGAEVGSRVADKVLDWYDEKFGDKIKQQDQGLTTAQERRDSATVVAERIKSGVEHSAHDRIDSQKERVADRVMERSYEMGKH